ncbi:MAG: PD-(D/E)XK nuclease family protein [Clostridia bacterium]|nr:PD-(D/E)XK nuclease family protein [Clostridia bacterium]
MKLNLFYGRTYFESFEKIILDLKENYSKDENYLFIVPDRFTLWTERYVMEKLGIMSTFNIDILTLNTLANRNCLINDYVDNETGTMILSKVIFGIRDKLKVLKSTQGSFSEEMYALISQIKSSRVPSSEFLDCEFKGSDFEKLKKQDIALIYSEYEKYLQETGVDSVKKFEIFIDEIKNIESVKTSCVYIAGFESFTCQGYAIIENLIKYSKGVKIASLNYMEQNNKYLYPCDVSYQIKRICSNLKIECVVDDKKLCLNNENIVNNLWAIKGQKGNEIINVYESDTLVEEYRKVCELIWENVIKNGYKFNDFNIVLNVREQNEKLLCSVLEDYNISYFSDTSQNLSNFLVIKFICQVNECVLKNFDRLSFIEYSKSPFVEGSVEEKNNFENFANTFTIRYGDFYKRKKSLERAEGYEEFITYSSGIAQKILDYKKNFVVSKDKITNYIKGTRSLLEIFDLKKKFEEILNSYKEENKEIQYKFGKKVFERLDTLLLNLDRVLGDTVVSFREFVSILQSGLFATKISIVPQSVDAVFVGDINKSFFLPRKVNYFLDCENNLMPMVLNDSGIFSDEDIENSKTKFKIDPQIKMLNKKIKLKTLSLMCLGEINLFYSLEGGKESGKIINDLDKICKVNFNKCQKEGYYYSLGKNALMEHLTINYQNQRDFVLKIKECLKENLKVNFEKLVTELPENKYLSDFHKDIFLQKDKFSVSQIESFYSCPFKHFIKYGLRLKEKKDSDLSKSTIGDIIHEFCQKSFDYIESNEDSQKISDKIFEEIIIKNKFLSVVNNPKNANMIKGLKVECVRIFEALKYQNKFSEFKQHLMEDKFYCNFAKIYKDYFDKVIDFVTFDGKVDRIDFDDDDFIVIDYKTGNTDMDYGDIYYGRKLQVLAYAIAIEKKLNKNCIGVFYMPIKNKFTQKNENKYQNYKLSGLYLLDEFKASKIDKKILMYMQGKLEEKDEFGNNNNTSDIINATINKQNSIKPISSNLTSQEFTELKKYVLNMINNALIEIKNGNVGVMPYSNGYKLSSCNYCDYKGICKLDNFTKYREITNIKKVNILGKQDSALELTSLENIDGE